MAALKTIRKFKCPIALCGIMAFVIVVGCSVLCDLGLIPFASAQSAVVSASHQHDDHAHNDGGHQGKQDDHGNHDHNSHDHGNHHHDGASDHHDQSPEDKDCCGDLTQRFYTSLTEGPTGAVKIAHVQLSKVLATLFLEQAPVVIKPVNLSHVEFHHLANGPPGRNGQVLRILFRSFQI